MSNPRPDPTETETREAESTMLSPDPPHGVVRWTAWLLILLFTTAFLVSLLVPVPETVRCRFQLVSESGYDPVQAKLLAVVDQVTVREGQAVEEGEILFALRSDEIRSWRTELEVLEEDRTSLRERRRKAEESHQQLVEITGALLANARQEAAYNRKHLDNRVRQVERMAELQADGILSEAELENYRLEAEQSAKNLEVSEKILEQTQKELQRLETERDRERALELAEANKLDSRIAALRRQLVDCEGDLMLVRAPYDAVVTALAFHQNGSVVDEGQPLCQLARNEGDPVARLFLSERGLPRLKEGLPAKLLLDAFPYQRYGTIDGVIDWLSPTPVDEGGISQFIGRAVLQSDHVQVHEEPIPLRIGMTGEARIRVGHRTLIEFAFEPIRQLRENLSH